MRQVGGRIADGPARTTEPRRNLTRAGLNTLNHRILMPYNWGPSATYQEEKAPLASSGARSMSGFLGSRGRR
jgi:hypothetical protein